MLGRLDEAEWPAREAVALADRTDFPIDRAGARLDLAEVPRPTGRSEEAETTSPGGPRPSRAEEKPRLGAAGACPVG